MRIHWDSFSRNLLYQATFRLLSAGKNTTKIKIDNVFLKKSFLVYPTLTNSNQTERKTYDANDILALSLGSIIVYTIFPQKLADLQK